jgi:hypothetical protein
MAYARHIEKIDHFIELSTGDMKETARSLLSAIESSRGSSRPLVNSAAWLVTAKSRLK